MGYASLTYVNNGTILATTVLHDIVGCVTGRFSSSLQLQGASTSTSEIVNTLGENWNFTYPASSSFVPTSANNTLASWVLTAPCVDPSKTKYVRLINYYKNNTNSAAPVLGATGTGVTNLYASTAAPCGILLQAITSASSATSVNNPTHHNTNGSNVGGNVATHQILNGTNIIVSWSSRHLIIWSNGVSSTTNNILLGYIEFPETDITVAQNLIPAAFVMERNGSLNSVINIYGPYDTNTATATQGDIQFPSFYNPLTKVNGPSSFTGLVSNIDILTSTISSSPKPVNTIPTINNFGSNRLMFLPIILNLISIGVPLTYLSTYSNMYTVTNGLGSAGDTITVGSDTYAYLPSNTGMSFVVKKE